MKVQVYVSPSAAVRAGLNQYGVLTVDLDMATIPEHIREVIATAHGIVRETRPSHP